MNSDQQHWIPMNFSRRTSQTLLSLSLLCSRAASAPAPSSGVAQPPVTTCGCYQTGGSSGGYFQNYNFFDFRNVDNSKGLYNSEPALITDSQSKGKEAIQTGFLGSTGWSNQWDIQSWGHRVTNDQPLRTQNSPQNVFIQAEKNTAENATTRLTLRSTRLSSFVSNSEIEGLQKNLMFASIRFRARVRGASGAVAGLFTYFDDNNESDVEILTRDPKTEVRCTNQPSVNSRGNIVQTAEKDAFLSGKSWTDWNTYRIDWTPTMSAWYLNGVNMVNNTYSIPRQPSFATLNMWSDGGVWSGVMPVGSSAYMDIGWIEMAFNTSGPITGPSSRMRRAGVETAALEKRTKYASAGSCAVVCSVDNSGVLGKPAPIVIG